MDGSRALAERWVSPSAYAEQRSLLQHTEYALKSGRFLALLTFQISQYNFSAMFCLIWEQRRTGRLGFLLLKVSEACRFTGVPLFSKFTLPRRALTPSCANWRRAHLLKELQGSNVQVLRRRMKNE